MRPSRWPRSRCRGRCPGNPVADRPAAGTAGAGMTSAGGRCHKRRQPRCALMRAEQHVSVPRCGQLAVLTACRPRRARFTVAHDGRRGDPGLATIRESGECHSLHFTAGQIAGKQPFRGIRRNQQPSEQPPTKNGLSRRRGHFGSKPFIILVPGGGVEPPRGCPRRILSFPRTRYVYDK